MNTNDNAKRILCYGDSNTWGWVPLSMGNQRYTVKNRWPGILQDLLGKDYEIIEEGLSGRTTAIDDPRPEFPERNGLKTLPIILETHLPLDYIIIMLGTPDTKEMFNLSSEKITNGIHSLIQTIKNYRNIEKHPMPQILIVVPPIINENSKFASKLFKGGALKATKLINLYKNLALNEKVLYLNPTKTVTVDSEEGIHINEKNHKKLAELIYKKITKK